MWRYWVGAVAALVLVAGGLFYWRSTAVARRGETSAAVAAATPSIDGNEGEEGVPTPPAASEKTREQKRFSRIDHDKNGQISRDEFLAARRRAFDKLYINGDGKLSFDEYAVKTEQRFAKADTDKSGSLNPAEFATTKVVRKTKPTCACDQQPADQQPADPKGDDGQ